jgi:hypothetical protein
MDFLLISGFFSFTPRSLPNEPPVRMESIDAIVPASPSRGSTAKCHRWVWPRLFRPSGSFSPRARRLPPTITFDRRSPVNHAKKRLSANRFTSSIHWSEKFFSLALSIPEQRSRPEY